MNKFGGSSSFDSTRLRSDISVLSSLVPFLWPKGDLDIKSRVIGAIIFIIIAKIASAYVPYFMKLAVDLLDAGVSAIPLWVILAYGAARLLSLVFAQLRDAVFAKVGLRAVRKSSSAVLNHLHSLSLRFHLERQTGGLSRSIERGTVAIQSLLSITLFNLFPTIFEVLLVTTILWVSFDISIALVVLLTVVFYVVFTAYATEWRLKFRREMNRLDNKANTRAVDSLLNYETVKVFGNEKLEVSEYDTVMGEYERAATTTQVSLAYLNIGQAAIIAVGVTILMVMASVGVVNGELTQGDFVMINTYMLQLAQPLNFFGFVYRNIKQSLVDIEKMFDLLDEKPDVEDMPSAQIFKGKETSISFDGVSFSYDKQRPILRKLSFHIPSGKSLAIVGSTGSGKSTIARLLFRMYDVDSGNIRIDGCNVKSLTQESLHSLIGIVPQDIVLFNNTILYNLSYARVGANEVDISDAIKSAAIDKFIDSLPEGYNTMVGERGLKLSGGEKQRIAIARVLLKNSPILVFDEATSALDTHTEKAIQNNLSQISCGKTTLMIAHRLSTVVDADEIIFLERGEVIERGTHQCLLNADGHYAKMWRRQQEAFSSS